MRVPEETEQPGLQTDFTTFNYAQSIVRTQPTAIQKIKVVLEQNKSQNPLNVMLGVVSRVLLRVQRGHTGTASTRFCCFGITSSLCVS